MWQVGLLDVVLSECPDKSHNVTNLIFMTQGAKKVSFTGCHSGKL